MDHSRKVCKEGELVKKGKIDEYFLFQKNGVATVELNRNEEKVMGKKKIDCVNIVQINI